MKVEICLDSPSSILAAKQAGAHRIELCSSLAEGGLSPSPGLIDFARLHFGTAVMTMLRPRGGDFVYSEAEMETILADLEAAKNAGFEGVVFGALHPDGSIHQQQLAQVMEAAGPMSVTFHRAFDVCRDLSDGLDILIAHGVTRVLTSGGEPDVQRGRHRLGKLVGQAAGRIIILAGGGLVPGAIPELAGETGCTEFHLSARQTRQSPMTFRREDIPMGSTQLPGDYLMKEADPDLIKRAVNVVESISW